MGEVESYEGVSKEEPRAFGGESAILSRLREIADVGGEFARARLVPRCWGVEVAAEADTAAERLHVQESKRAWMRSLSSFSLIFSSLRTSFSALRRIPSAWRVTLRETSPCSYSLTRAWSSES